MSILFKSVDGALDIGRAWLAVGSPAPTALVNARLQQHWAVQVVSAVAHTHAKPLPDDSHTACQWQGATGMMRGQPVGGGARLRAALAPGPLALRLIGERDGAVVDELSLPGRTLDEAYDWMAERLAVHSDGRISGPLGRRDYDMPDGSPGNDRSDGRSIRLDDGAHRRDGERHVRRAIGVVFGRGVRSRCLGAKREHSRGGIGLKGNERAQDAARRSCGGPTWGDRTRPSSGGG